MAKDMVVKPGRDLYIHKEVFPQPCRL